MAPRDADLLRTLRWSLVRRLEVRGRAPSSVHRVVLPVALLVACRAAQEPPPTSVVEGFYSLGPVEFHGAEHNACGPYLAATEQQYGPDLVGIGVQYSGHAELCDACVEVTTHVGTQVVARVVTYGETVSPGDVDLSSHAFARILRPDPNASPERPRPMSWRVVPCPGAAPLAIQFQTQANPDWTAFWIRNPTWPIRTVEVRSAHHPAYVTLRRETDGTFVDDAGFGAGPATLRIWATTGASIDVELDGIRPGQLVATARRLP